MAARNTRFQARITEAEIRAIKKAAAEQGLDASSFVRNTVFQAIGYKGEDGDHQNRIYG